MEPIGDAAKGMATRPQSTPTLSDLSARSKTLETARIAKILLGWIDPREASDPEIFTAGIIAVLSIYPIDVQRIVADPRSAVLARFREVWPFPERVRMACEDVYAPTRRRLEREKAIAAQLAERDDADRREAERASHPTGEEIRAKYGEHLGLDPKPDPDLAPTDEARREESVRIRIARAIEREYAAAGYQPIMAGNLLISPSLLKNLGKWPPKGEVSK